MGLLNLPNELILSIAEASTNREISALTRTNRHLYDLLIDYLYRKGLKSGHAVYDWCCETGMVASLQRFMRCGLNVEHYPLLEPPPLWIAASHGHSTIIRILCENGISLDRDICFNYDPLVEAVRQRHQAATQVLLDYGMDINYCDRLHSSPLIMAVSNNDWEMCTLLISRGAHLGIPTKNRESDVSIKPCWTALHEAVRTKSRSPDMIALLLSIGADVNVKAGDGRTPLHWTASEWFHVPTGTRFGPVRANRARLLLEHGADLNIVDNDNTAPMDYAEGIEGMVELFLEYGASKSLPRGAVPEGVSTAV